ncbi:MAG: autotransporter-associated beta strand repeat-containing protein [Planctomycetes bacterium]|nr:autotransporter-associated beta strand repeat-containing protein [Planctomycetota bacterium]
MTSKTILATFLAAGLSAVWVALAAGPAQAENWWPLWYTAVPLSQARCQPSATSADGKVFFAGVAGPYAPSNVVDIFDVTSLVRTTTSLSEARSAVAATSAGGRVFVGGGNIGEAMSDVVDIFDAATLTPTTTSLSQARTNLAAASAGGKVFIGGGANTITWFDLVDVFDAATLARTTISLSQARSWLAATSAGGKVFFAGGSGADYLSDVLDIFDATTLAHTTTTLSQASYNLQAASAGGKVFFAGGTGNGGPSYVVDIFDVDTLARTTISLPDERLGFALAAAGDKVFFAGGLGHSGPYSNRVDIYDTTTGTWSTTQLSQGRIDLSAASAGNRVFFGGGYTGSAYSNVVDVYTLQNYGTITSTKAWTLIDNTTVAGRMLLNGGSLNLDGYDLVVGSMAGIAPISLGGHTLTAGGDGTSSTYSGALSGHGGLTKTGAGTLTLSATSSCDGTTRVSGGALKVAGSIAASGVLIDGGTLQGAGRVGAITGTSGHLHPGGSPGILASASLVMSLGFHFDVSLDGPAAGTDYSQLDVTGAVDLGGATLDAALGYAPAWYSGGGPPDLLYIIKNDGTDAVTGQFDGLPQMSEFDLLYNGTTYQAMISYEGDYDAAALTGGNDVVVALPEPATLSLLALGGLLAMRRPRSKSSPRTVIVRF